MNAEDRMVQRMDSRRVQRERFRFVVAGLSDSSKRALFQEVVRSLIHGRPDLTADLHAKIDQIARRP